MHRTCPTPRSSLPSRVAFLTTALCGGVLAWNASGTTKSANGTPLAGVTVTIQDSAAAKTTLTDATGAFSIGSLTAIRPSDLTNGFSVRQSGGALLIHCAGEGTLQLSLVDVAGKTLWNGTATLAHSNAEIPLPNGLRFTAAFLRVRHGSDVFYQPVMPDGASGWTIATHLVAARSMAAFPKILFKKPGYRDTSLTMTAESATGLAVVLADTGSAPSDFVEDHRKECTIPTLPAVSGLTAISNFPDPFKMMDGTAMTTLAQVKCRREEVNAMYEKYVMGEKPRNPEKVTGTLSGSKFTVTVTDKGKTISFEVTISKPSGAGPFAALIGLDGGGIPGSFSGLPVATINFPQYTLASEGSGRGKGKFYDLYGSGASAGECMAWAWGVSRLIDALAANPSVGINPRKLAVTGCSRLGKGAFVIGAMDQRIALTIPQEGGSGGLAAWRLIAATPTSQSISSTVSEQYWTRADLNTNFGSNIGKLPIDNHEVAGFIAPRGFLALENSIDHLGPTNGYGAAIGALEIYKAMGAPEAITYSSVGAHGHCTLPTTQNHWVASYMNKFLLDKPGETAKIEGQYTFDKAKWITWTTPTLK